MGSLLDATTVQPRPSDPGALAVRSVGLTIVHHPDPARAGEVAPLFDLDARVEVELSRIEPVFRSPAGRRTGALETPLLSRTPLLIGGDGGAGVRLRAPEGGSALLVDGERLHGERALDDARVRAGVVLELADAVVLLLHVVELVPRAPELGLLGESPAMHALRAEIVRVADLDVPVLLRGETGSGKELVARAIHERSARREGAFVAVNAAALPESTAAAELFGHTRGAFTGADAARKGYFEQAHGGTLFLDEVSDLPESVQPMLLRALETGELQRLGGGGARADVRVVSATDADLERDVARGRFREPLLHRLAGYELRVPPLRERRADIGPLLVHFLRAELAAIGEADKLAAPAPGKRGFLRASFVARLARHDFPGNVRELRNLARRIAVVSRGSARMQLDDGLRSWFERAAQEQAAAAPPPVTSDSARPSRRAPLIGDEQLVAALRGNGFALGRTAAALNVSRTWLNERVERCPLLRKAKDVGADEIARARDAHGGDIDRMAAALEVSPRGLVLQMKRLGLR